MLQDRITNLGTYFRGIESYNDALIVKVLFPEKWGVYDSADGTIKTVKSEDTVNEYFYYGDSHEVDLETIFDLIDETIEMNKSVLKKIELLRNKVEELKELFDNKSLQELETLKFVTEKPKTPKAKKKYTRKKKSSQNEEKTPSEETVAAVVSA